MKLILDKFLIYVVCVICVFSSFVTANQRQVLMKVAKELSESLENMIIKTDKDISQLRIGQDAVIAEIEMLKEKINTGQDTTNLQDNLAAIENRVAMLESQRDVDLMFFNYTNLVHNTNIELLSQNLTEQINKLNETLSSKLVCNDKPIIPPVDNLNNKTDSQNSSDVTKNTLSNLDNLQNLLNSYDYDYDYNEEPNPNQPTLKNFRPKLAGASNPAGPPLTPTWEGSVPALLQMTHQLISDLNSKFLLSTNQISDFSEKMKEVSNEVKSKMDQAGMEKALKAESEFTQGKLNRLEASLGATQNLFRNELDIKAEDIELMKKLTDSRLSVYEKRIDILESMILNFTEDSSNSPSGGNNDDQLTNQAQGPYDGSLSFMNPPSTEMPLPPPIISSTTVKSRELEFSVADDLDKLAATFLNDNTGGANNDPSSISNDNTFNDYDSYYYEREGEELFGMPGAGRLQNQQPSTLVNNQQPDLSKTKRSGTMNMDASCDCKDTQARLTVLESSFGTMVSEVESQMAGIQASITKMVHRLQVIEGSMGITNAGNGKPQCKSSIVNKSQGRGMDEWCEENCANGNCPQELCNCT